MHGVALSSPLTVVGNGHGVIVTTDPNIPPEREILPIINNMGNITACTQQKLVCCLECRYLQRDLK